MTAQAPAIAPRQSILLFDFDGVIADSFDVFFEQYSQTVRALGYPHLDSKETLLRLFEGNVFLELAKVGFPVYRLRRFANEIGPRLSEAVARIKPFPKMPEIVSQLAAVYPTFIITSNVRPAVESFCSRCGIRGVQDILGVDIEPSKVKKIRAVRKRFPQHTAYYLGDTKGDMVEGHRAGAVTVAVTWGMHPRETLAEGKPDHWMDTPDALLHFFLPECLK